MFGEATAAVRSVDTCGRSGIFRASEENHGAIVGAGEDAKSRKVPESSRRPITQAR
jgi:hypothetical protein